MALSRRGSAGEKTTLARDQRSARRVRASMIGATP